MSKLRTFKAQKGKVLYCPSGDIVFSDRFYTTDKEDELKAIEKGIDIEEVTGTDEAKGQPTGKKRSVVNPTQQKKDIEKEQKDKEKKEEEKKEEAKVEKKEKKEETEMVKVEVTQEMVENYPEEFEGLEVGDFIEVSKEMSVEDAKAYLVQLGVELPEEDEEVIELAVEKASEELHKEDEEKEDDVETMPKSRCVELLKQNKVAFKQNDGVAVLRELVKKIV